MTDCVIVERRSDIAIVRLNRPESLNALDLPARRALAAALVGLANDAETRVVVLTGAGKAFCSGADLKAAAENPDKSPRRVARTLLHDFQPLLESIMRMDKPVIAAVNGVAAGIGMPLVLACDLVVMAEDAYLKSPFVGMGLIPDGGAAWFLTRRIGYPRAFEVLAQGQRVSADQCMAFGIANRVVAREALEDAALEWAGELAVLPPLSLGLTKRISRHALTSSFADAVAMEAELQVLCASSEDAREAIAAFAEKRHPAFKGR